MGKQIDITKDYSKYRTLSILTNESIAEYEALMQPDPVQGLDVYAMLKISSKEAQLGTEKEVDVTIAGVKKRILVKIPADIASGTYIRYREKGEPGQFGGRNGDLYVRVVFDPAMDKEKELEKNPMDGRDINCTLVITIDEWVKGVEKEKEVTIDGISKRVLVKVPPAIQNGAAIRYKGMGEAGKYGGKNGDLLVRVVVKTETKNEDIKKENIKKEDIKKEDNFKPEPTKENTLPISITFLEAAKGTEKEIILPEKATCNVCQGTGMVLEKSFLFRQGKKKTCAVCQGSGLVDAPKKIRLQIPAGIDENHLLYVKSSTEQLKLNQDWYIQVAIEKHPKFERKGYDIYSTEVLPFYIGSGRMVGVDTLDGKQYCNITKEIKDGSQTCLKNKGITKLNNPSVRGNHYVTWKKK